LQRVRMSGWKVPQVALLEVVDEAAALGVKCSDADLALEHVSPLGFLVPVEFANDALVEAHVDTSELLARAKLANGSLTGPAAFFDANVRVRKRPAHVGNRTMISAGRADQVRVLTFTLSVARAQDISAIAISLVLSASRSLNAMLGNLPLAQAPICRPASRSCGPTRRSTRACMGSLLCAVRRVCDHFQLVAVAPTARPRHCRRQARPARSGDAS
jgi:hypothetical protein